MRKLWKRIRDPAEFGIADKDNGKEERSITVQLRCSRQCWTVNAFCEHHQIRSKGNRAPLRAPVKAAVGLENVTVRDLTRNSHTTSTIQTMNMMVPRLRP